MSRINRNSTRSNNSGGNNARSFGKNNNTGNTGNTSGKQSDFLRIGSITVTKATQDAHGDGIVGEFRSLNASLMGEIYLPEGQNAITLNHGTKVLIRLSEVNNAPDYVVGTLNLIKGNN